MKKNKLILTIFGLVILAICIAGAGKPEYCSGDNLTNNQATACVD